MMKFFVCYQIQFTVSIVSVIVSLILILLVVNTQFWSIYNSQYNFMNINSDDLSSKEIQDLFSIKKTDSKPIRIVCWIMCTDMDLETRAQFIKDTWGPRCDITLYFSDSENKTFPTIGLYPPGIGRKYLSHKSKAAWTYVYNNYIDQGDFFVKADDDTFIIVENLRQYLSDKDVNALEYYGRRFQFRGQGTIYMSGGAAIVLTRKALIRLVKDAYPKHCMPIGQMEDLKTGRCLSLVNVHPIDTRDEFEKERFHPFPPKYHLHGEYPRWFHLYDLNGAVSGRNCCSDYPISFHYIRGAEQLALDFLFYHSKVSNEK